MPKLEFEILEKLQEDYHMFPHFLETGTLFGDTIFSMEPHFKHLYTVELKPEFYERAKQVYQGDKIEFHLGDSSIVLPDLVPRIDENTIMFLDGHYSCGNTAQGAKDCPLYEELEAIRDGFRPRAIIIIDDCRLFGLGPSQGYGCDWEDIMESRILDVIRPRIKNWYYLPSCLHERDRMIIHVAAMGEANAEPTESPTQDPVQESTPEPTVEKKKRKRRNRKGKK